MRLSLPLTVLILFGASCEKAPSARVPAPPQAAAETKTAPAQVAQASQPKVDSSGWLVSGPTDDGRFARCAGLSFEKPVEWPWVKPSMRFRTLQYSVPGTDGDGAAELIFSVFAAGDGGPVDANIDRWVGQFSGTDGQPPRSERSSGEVAGMKYSQVELEGSYAGMGAAAPRPGWAQLGVIIQAPGRNVFIRLLGPDKTVLANKDVFEKMLQSTRSDIATGAEEK